MSRTLQPELQRPARLPFRMVAAVTGAALALLLGTTSLQNAVANGETRTISLYQTHTKESLTVTFRRNGAYDPDALKKLNWMLRDWRRDEPTEMEPKLFDIVWSVQREVGSKEPIHVVSAYRSPQTNSMLRRRSRAVAEHSQHMLGRAMDFYLPDADMGQVRAIGMRLQRGGVGYYPNAFNPFVHLDAGSVRSWPRMTRDQLAGLFPDGKTVHIPRDGKPMPGYEVAKAEILAAGGTVAGTAYADAGEQVPTASSGRSFWAFLFGGADEEEDAEFARPGRGNSRPNLRTAGPPPSDSGDDARTFFLRDQRNQVAQASTPAPAPAPAAPAPAPVVVAAAPQPVAAVTEPAAPIPVPTPRPPELARVAAVDPSVGLTRPPEARGAGQLAWQAGPDGVVAIPGAAAFAAIPEPPRRPDAVTGTTEVAGLGAPVLALPEPPRRPAELSILAEAGLLGSQPESQQLAALSYAAVSHPAPPARPAEPSAVASIRAPVAAAVLPVPGESIRTRTAPAAPQPVTPPAGQPAATASTASSRDRDELQRLFDQAALVGEPAADTRIAMARAKPTPVAVSVPSAPAAAVVSRFGGGPDLTTDRFTGPAVKPLPTASFAPAN